jgi:hypothetical protein
MELTEADIKARELRARLKGLHDKQRWNDIASILDGESRKKKLELWQLVTMSRAILLGDDETFTLESSADALEEALEREPDYVPAMLEMAFYLDTHADQAEEAIDLFRQAADVILEQLLEALRGWSEARLLDDEVRKELVRSYNRFLEDLHRHGLTAGSAAKRIDWFDPAQHGEDL